jgi:hypothetical protein
MRVLARRIKHPLDVTIQRSHDGRSARNIDEISAFCRVNQLRHGATLNARGGESCRCETVLQE